MGGEKKSTKPKTDAITQLAEAIATDLFTSFIGMADRLVLEMPNKTDGGGWCFGAVVRRVEMQLRARKVKL